MDPAAPLPQWAIDMTSPPPKQSKVLFRDPPGYSSGARSSTKQKLAQQPTTSAVSPSRKAAETDALKLKKAWEIAFAPAKQLPMNAIMMYMSGNSLQIFSIMMVVMLFKGPIQGLLATNSAFARFQTEGTKQQLMMVKAVYVLMQLVLLAVGIWKVNAMGLLPTTRSDWLAWESERQPLERAYFAFR